MPLNAPQLRELWFSHWDNSKEPPLQLDVGFAHENIVEAICQLRKPEKAIEVFKFLYGEEAEPKDVHFEDQRIITRGFAKWRLGENDRNRLKVRAQRKKAA